MTARKRPHNQKPHNKRFPYKLELDGSWAGCYEDSYDAGQIGRATVRAGDAKRYTVRDLNDSIVAED